MKRLKMLMFVILLFVNLLLSTGCWNYREVDEVAIVAGVAVDKGENDKVKITAEVVHISGSGDAKVTSQLIEMEGKSIFDAARNGISLTGRKLYWSHIKVIILSKEIARDGIVEIIDWFLRDAETRAEVHILVSRGETAEEIFHGRRAIESVKSFELDVMMSNLKNLSKAPNTSIWDVANDFLGDGLSATLPAISLKDTHEGKIPEIMGTAIFKGDKFVEFLDGEETKAMLFIQGEVKGGVITVDEGIESTVTLEIFKSKTKVKPVIKGDQVAIDIKVDLVTAIDEIECSKNFIEDKGRKRLEEAAEMLLKKEMGNLISKMQSQYAIDIFGFGAKLRECKPKVWNELKNNWEEEFKNLKVNIDVNVHVRNSATLAEPLEVGD